MSKLALHAMVLWIGLATTGGSFAVTVKPQQVLDLDYGEVLFHFYQQDYFTAITHLMVAQQQERLEHHRDESELLLAGLQLSYGMLDQSERRFAGLLDESTDRELRNRVWYYLTKISYQRGHHHRALQKLQFIDEAVDGQMAAELALLNANLHMALGRDLEAAQLLDGAKGADGWDEYLSINRGIALLRAGDIEAGQQVLNELGERQVEDEELSALRDRANLGLGYQLLRVGEAEQARQYLNRVRLQGPFKQAAMLGAGYQKVLWYAYSVSNLLVMIAAALAWWRSRARGAGCGKVSLGLLLLLTVVNVAVTLLACVESIAPELMHKPLHHCLYCLMQFVPDAPVFTGLFVLGSFAAVWVALLYGFASRWAEAEALRRLTRRLLVLAVICLAASLEMVTVHLIAS